MYKVSFSRVEEWGSERNEFLCQKWPLITNIWKCAFKTKCELIWLHNYMYGPVWLQYVRNVFILINLMYWWCCCKYTKHWFHFTWHAVFQVAFLGFLIVFFCNRDIFVDGSVGPPQYWRNDVKIRVKPQ